MSAVVGDLARFFEWRGTTGATFPAPLYQQWFQEYGKKHKDVRINYQAKGSGAGIQDFKQGLVDFAASDAAMKDEEVKEVARGVQFLPVTAGSIVLGYNLPNLKGELKLSRDVYAGIFLGKDLMEVSMEEWSRLVAINMTGVGELHFQAALLLLTLRLSWIVVSIVWGMFNKEARQLRPPPPPPFSFRSSSPRPPLAWMLPPPLSVPTGLSAAGRRAARRNLPAARRR